ncbi:MAG: 30S ribosomal protein S6 [Clostridia bacterium]|nr:30S ribosomal protein S6 [Clostridia bacterium]
MYKYETVILLKPSLSEERIKKIKAEIENKINSVGKVTKNEDIGIKKTAYEIQKNKEAYYIVYKYNTNKEPKDSVKKIEQFYRTLEEILRFITVKEE